MATNNYKRIQRVYGVDLGARNISITRIDLDATPFGDATLETTHLRDRIGKTTILNGVQMVKPGQDAVMMYKVRKMGSECNRSKPFYSTQYIDGKRGDSEVDISLPDREQVISEEVLNTMIIAEIRDLIDSDMRENPINSVFNTTEARVKVVFGISESSALNRSILRWRINQVFFAEGDDDTYELEFITESTAVAFARFYQHSPDFFKRKPVKRESETILILNAGHTSTEMMKVEIDTDPKNADYGVKVLDRIRIQKGGRDLDQRIARIIKKLPDSKDVENVKHDLSMYSSTRCTVDDGDSVRQVKISRDMAWDDFSLDRDILTNFVRGSNCSMIELVGGHTRSFVIQEILKDLPSEISIRRGLTADEATAQGVAIYGVVSYVKNRIEFETNDHRTVRIKSPWTKTVGETHEVGGYYSQVCNFSTCKVGNHDIDSSSLRMMQARDYELRKQGDPSDIRMMTIKCSNVLDVPITINYEDMDFNLNVDTRPENNHGAPDKCWDFATDLYIKIDSLDLPDVVGVTYPGSTIGLSFGIDFENVFDQRSAHSDQDMNVECEIRHLNKMYERVGDLFNRMEAFYFDRDGYQAKKESLRHEIERIKGAYAYSLSAVENIEASYKKLLDTHEFCRIVTVDPDLLNESMYCPDPEVVVDPRLTQEIIDTILKDEKGVKMLEEMMNSV